MIFAPKPLQRSPLGHPQPTTPMALPAEPHLQQQTPSNVFVECLQLSQQLGLQPAPSGRDGESARGTAQLLTDFAMSKHRFVQQQSRLQQWRDHADAGLLVDQGVMDHRAERLQEAAGALRQLADNSATLALRFKDVTANHTVPVEPELQPQFTALVASAASYQGPVHAQQHGPLAWAAAFSDPPRTWEQHLGALGAVGDVCKAYHKQSSAAAAAVAAAAPPQPGI